MKYPLMYKSKDCVSDRIKKIILDRICAGTYAPGQRLVELQLAKEFDISQAPIREALCELEAMRIVETEPFKGTHVREITSKEWQECLEIRGVLEQFAAEKIADRVKDRIDDLKKKALETVKAARKNDIQKYGLANIDFHRLIVEATGNQTLITVWESLATEVRALASIYAQAAHLNQAAQDHLEIVEAFSEGDNRYAGKLLRIHAEAVLVPNKAWN
jgi:DNA-binding GntR family transcriptional regulator